MGEMGECRGGGGGGGDCLIKLFGKTIPVPEASDSKDLQHSGSTSSSSLTESDGNKENPHQHQDTCLDPPPQPEVVDAEDPKSSPSPLVSPRPGDVDDDEATNCSKEKLKKPDKVLPCPRCNSMDTKFCYFNNYNVNQPRYFCKNCQRYWTAGGAMRNVPVGAGRRKNKNAVAASQFLQRVRAAAASDPLKTGGGTVLSFGHHDLAEQVSHLKEKLLVPIGSCGSIKTTVGPCSEGSSNRDDKSIIKENVTVDRPANEVHHPANMNGATSMWPYSCAPSQAYYPPGIAIPIYPAAPGYWGCMVPGGWSLPWAPVQSPTTQGLSSPTSAPSVSSSGAADSLTLGKHARDGDEGRSSHGSGGKVWAPKTIRIDDVDEVARSSIWSLIGIKGDDKQINTDNMDGQRKHGTVFDLKHDAMKAAKQAMITSSPLLHGNPVALTRSLTFQEGS